jgi:CRP-like cAMP-binding protein
VDTLVDELPESLGSDVKHHLSSGYFEKVPVFSKLISGAEDNQFVEVMESALSFEIVPAGEHLFTVGEAGTVFYFVKSGTVDLMITNPTGVYVLYESVGEGGFFGEVAPLVSAGRRPCVAIARCACSLMTLQASALNDLLVVYPTIRPGLYKAALQRFVEIANAQGGAKFLSWVHAAGLSPPTLVTRDSWTCNECRESVRMGRL